MDSPPSPTYPQIVSYPSEYTEARSKPYSISDAIGTRPNSLVEDPQQLTLKGHTDEQKQDTEAPSKPHSISDAIGTRPNSLVEDQQQRTLKGHTDEQKQDTEARSKPHSISDAFGTRPSSLVEDPQQLTLKGHTDEQKQVLGRVTSYNDEPGYINRSLGQDYSVTDQERARPPSHGDIAGKRPKSEYDDPSTYVHVKPPSQGKVRVLNPSYEDN